MNLKEAFRYQNKFSAFLKEAENVLACDNNVCTIEETHLRSRVDRNEPDETVTLRPETKYADDITELVGFVMFLIKEKEHLSAAVRSGKTKADIDIDAETNLNAARQQAARILTHMADLRSTEETFPSRGYGYKFSSLGEQKTYKCPLKRVTTIHYNRNEIRRSARRLNARADIVSAEIDRCLVNTNVDYKAPFDVNASFDDAFEGYLDMLTKSEGKR